MTPEEIAKLSATVVCMSSLEGHVLSSEALRTEIEALQTQLNTDMAAEGLTAADLGFVDDVKPGAVHRLKPGESPLSVTPNLLRIGQLEKAAEVFGQEITRLTTERDKYSAALREIIQDPVPNLTHVKIAKAALGW